MTTRVIVLCSVRDKIFVPNDHAYLDAIIKLYPKYKDKALENYLKMIEGKNKRLNNF
ncbi:MAG: hypothetical protein HON47_01565 [Candidatus Diapherotrites archaeon]|uniref:Uncharacterized protein n=1 Tax=Candidatus Iainarchaeum sp. TaxID=3101447 RepID=A0A8T5GEJ7_9ARCH|nr:hypothetical protein [Candidatus Diapherotrites archaeon]